MELRTLRYLLAFERAGSVTAAAAVVHVTQPSLSRQLRQLERDLGLTLFVRDSGRLRLSAAGREFIPVARRVVAAADDAAAAAAVIADGRMKRITIAAPGTTLIDVVAPFLSTLGTIDPLPAVRQEVPASVYLTLDGDADLAIGTSQPPDFLNRLAMANLPVWAYVPPGHGWAGLTSVSLEELLAQPLLLLSQALHPRQALDRAVTEARLAYRAIEEFDTADVAQAVAASGKGVAVVSDDPRFGLCPLGIRTPHGAIQISLWAAWRPEHHASHVIEDLATRLRDFCITRYGVQARPE